MKNYLSDKKPGFYVTLICWIVSLITLIVYTVGYGSTRYMSWGAFWIILAGLVGSIALIAFRLYRFTPSLLFATDTLGLCFFVYHIYYYVSSVVYGIQFSSFPIEFIATVVFFILSIVLSMAAIFMKQTDGKGERL